MRNRRNLARIIMRDFILACAVIGGATAAIGGPMVAALFAGLSLWGRDVERMAAVSMASVALGVAVTGIGLGLLLARAGWQALHGAADRRMGRGRWGLWLALFVATLLIGQAMAGRAEAAAVMPLVQVAAAALPALLCLVLALAAAGRGADLITRRPMLASLAWGGLGGASLALAAELILIVGAGVGVHVALQAVDPALIERLLAAGQEMQQTGRPLDLVAVRDIVASPVFAIGLLGLLGVAAPLVEELAKGLAVPLVIAAADRPGRLAGFLYGIAAGAGFALVEGVLNGAMALNMTEVWAGLMILRGAAAAMHCLASGLAGLGWQMVLVERRWLAGGVLGLLALSLHGAWNLSVGMIVLLSLAGSLAAAGPATVARTGAAGLLTIFLLCLGLLVIAGLALIPWRLATAAE